MKNLYLFFLAFSLIQCSEDKLNDKSKRNENYGWFVNTGTGVGEWVELGDEEVSEDGTYTLFYKSGTVREKGTIRNLQHADTVRIYDLDGKIIKYNIYEMDSQYSYYIDNGTYRSYYPTEELLEEGEVVDNRKSENWRSFHKNGNPRMNNYALNDSITIKTDYYESGILKDSFAELYGKEHGIGKYWYENGQLRHQYIMKHGVKDSSAILYFQEGSIMETSNWENDKKDGLCIGFFEEGGIAYKRQFTNGLEHGSDTSYFANGDLRVIGSNYNGKKHGIWRINYLNGSTYAEVKFIQGKMDGILKRYSHNGDLLQNEFYVKGDLDEIEVIKEITSEEQKHIDEIKKVNSEYKELMY